ncbi:DUF5107 domain-containing protein [Ruania albidiflava]|uniref:DUF5107 domain-containing protein n=1 Tax=Ruania albidiflava TaxID=366586 RepID=UPI0003B3D0DE|nr:DUF5107 domain-containing protein [Ruania albidiflava]
MLTEESPRQAEPVDLPPRPADQTGQAVAVWRTGLTLPTYLPEEPSTLPAYLDQRVYQGSSGRIYPLPFHERIAADPTTRTWDAIHLENEWLRVVVLPELGGRVHTVIDRSSGVDLFYSNPVVKPALVGLAGPWLAGGIEMNWPQHHRPATFLPTDAHIESHEDGSVTVWCSDHDPFERMKGMHGVHLDPGSAALELRVRLYNRTPLTQTFLWWANVAARVHTDYQAFFPTDVSMIADHAKRAVCAYPVADRPYYDLDYPARRDRTFTAASGKEVTGDRLDWWENIVVPTSYMVTHTDHDFFGGYDHRSQVGFVHVADRRVGVGKKLWTWGNSAFGRAWEANLADDASAYVELMAGVFTDNQPDFAFLAPGETKVFRQRWYPVRDVGPVQQATEDAALAARRTPSGLGVGVVPTRRHERLEVLLLPDGGARPGQGHSGAQGAPGEALASWAGPAAPDEPVQWEVDLTEVTRAVRVEVRSDGRLLLEHMLPGADGTAEGAGAEEAMHPAREPAAPEQVGTVGELVDIAGHLVQYRHATRSPEPYWAEALRRDPEHPGAHTAVGVRRLRQGRWAEAAEHLRRAVAALTAYHPTPPDMSAHYHLALALTALGDLEEAYDLLGRASWDRRWRAPAGYEMARLDAAAGRHHAARDRLADVLRTEPEHLQALTLAALTERRLGHEDAAAELLHRASSIDPLHWWTRHAFGEQLGCDAQTCLDVALEYAATGYTTEALAVLDRAQVQEATRVRGQTAAGPLLALHRADLLAQAGDTGGEATALAAAQAADARWCFPGRAADAAMLERMVARHPDHARAWALLGHWRYAVGREQEAVQAWRAAAGQASDAVVSRNLGLAAVNLDGDLAAAREHYDRALAQDPDDARLLLESDQLDRRRRVAVAERIATLQAAADRVAERDDLTTTLVGLLVSAGKPERARELMTGRVFQPWEGGEGEVLRAWERTCVALARRTLAAGDAPGALELLGAAIGPPAHLGEARHPLASTARLQLLLGDAHALAGQGEQAELAWRDAAEQVGDFRTMSAARHSENSYFSVLALRRLGAADRAEHLQADLAEFTAELASTEPHIPYFATSLPQLLLFPPDLREGRDVQVAFLRAQLHVLAGDLAAGQDQLTEVLAAAPDHAEAHDLLAELSDRTDQESAR